MVWLGGHYHVGLGRLDQYLMPYLQSDLDAGRLTLEAAEELLAEFFISLNKDSDLYPGVQQGDNGQTVTLGGVKPDGACAVNELTWMALRVSCDVAMIDPKINLRITPQTDLELLTLAAELTRKGLGFPQYANDEVVIPGLVAHGYELEDARNYTVAACWEFIIPGKGMEIVNIGAVSLPYAVDSSIRAALAAGEDFEHILAAHRRKYPQPGGWVGPGLRKPAAPACPVLLGRHGRLPGERQRPVPGPEIQQLRHPWCGLGQRRRCPGSGQASGLRCR